MKILSCMYAGFSGSSDKRSEKYKMPVSKAMVTNLYTKKKQKN